MVPRRILPERVFGSRATTIASLNEATGPIFSRISPQHSCSISAAGRLTPALSTTKPRRHLALERVGDADHRTFGNVLVRGQHFLHAAGREPVPGDIDDVVGAAHDVDEAIVVA